MRVPGSSGGWSWDRLRALRAKTTPLSSRYLPGLLDLLAKHPLAVNAGIAKLLTRYRMCRTVTTHLACGISPWRQWGNPWLSLNRVKWSLVDDDARAMVADWLKLVLIQQFFSLLAADGPMTPAGSHLWERYHQHRRYVFCARPSSPLGPKSGLSGSIGKDGRSAPEFAQRGIVG